MTSKEAAIHWRTLARKYHGYGFNVVPLGNDKRPVAIGVSKAGGLTRFRWEDWQEVRQEGRLFDALLEPAWWAEVKGVAGVCGAVSGNLVCFDFDHCPVKVVVQFLREFGLPDTYPWTVQAVRSEMTDDAAELELIRQSLAKRCVELEQELATA